MSIAPQLGNLKEVSGTMPHPLGSIDVKLNREGGSGVRGVVTLPEGLTGSFNWQGQTVTLHGGENTLALN